MCGSFSKNVPIWGRIFSKKLVFAFHLMLRLLRQKCINELRKKLYASLISLLKVKFYQKLGLFQRTVNVVTTKTNFHLNGFVILSRNLNKYFSHDQCDLIQYFRP